VEELGHRRALAKPAPPTEGHRTTGPPNRYAFWPLGHSIARPRAPPDPPGERHERVGERRGKGALAGGRGEGRLGAGEREERRRSGEGPKGERH